MKKLFIFFCIVFALTILIYPERSFAQASTSPAGMAAEDIPEWIQDIPSRVNLSPFGMLLDWSLYNYSWKCTIKSGLNCDGAIPVIQKAWSNIIVYLITPLIVLGILMAAIMLIASHGEAIEVNKLLTGFIISLIIIALSFSVFQFIYQIADVFQGFFLRYSFLAPCPVICISYTDLIPVALDFSTLLGLIARLLMFDLSVIPNIIAWVIFTILTQIIFFIISIVLMMRKIVLWFMIIMSPLFPLAFIFPNTRLLAKGLIGTFVMWLLYAPMMAILLHFTAYIFRKFDLGFLNPLAAWILSLMDIITEGIFTVIILIICLIAPFLLLKKALSLSASISDDIVLMRILAGMNLLIKSILNSVSKNTSKY